MTSRTEAQAQIDRVLRGAVEAGEVPGVVAMAASDAGPIYEGAFGMRSLGSGPGMTLDTVFRIHSMTKAITCVAALQLVEEGRLSLDAPVPDIGEPALAAPQVLDGFDATVVRTVKDASGVRAAPALPPQPAVCAGKGSGASNGLLAFPGPWEAPWSTMPAPMVAAWRMCCVKSTCSNRMTPGESWRLRSFRSSIVAACSRADCYAIARSYR